MMVFKTTWSGQLVWGFWFIFWGLFWGVGFFAFDFWGFLVGFLFLGIFFIRQMISALCCLSGVKLQIAVFSTTGQRDT